MSSLALVTALATLALCSCVQSAAAATLKVVPSDVRVRRAETPQSFTGSASISAARNEFESFQVVIDAGASAVNAASVSLAGSLSGPGGATIPASNITLYREDYVHIYAPSDGELFLNNLPNLGDRNNQNNVANTSYRCSDAAVAGGCYFPDILIPAVDPLYNEPRNAFPVNVPAGQTRVAWIDILVPQGQTAGAYTGQLNVSADNGATSLGTVQVNLQVLPFELPSNSTLGGVFDMNSNNICDPGSGAVFSCANTWQMFSLFARLALDDRVSISRIGGNGASPSAGNDADFTKYALPLLQGSSTLTRLKNAQLSEIMSYPYCTNCAADWKQALIAHGRPDLATKISFHCDEELQATCISTYPTANSAYQSVTPDTGRLRLQAITRSADRSSYGVLANQIDTDLIAINDMQPKGGASVRGSFQPWLDAEPLRHRLYMYEGCQSVGCDGVHGGDDTVRYWPHSLYDGWPSYGIDQPATEQRAMGWMEFKFGASGEYYYETVKWLKGAWKDCAVNNLDCIYAEGGNGDGTLFYPGTVLAKSSIGAPGIGGTHDIPLESMRLKAIRDSHEDYEYLRKVPTGQQAAASNVVDTLYTAMSNADVTPAQLYAAREQIAALIPSEGNQIGQADLSIAKTDAPDPVITGSELTYTLTVSNGGPNDASAVTVSDNLPAGETFVSVAPSQGNCTGTFSISCSMGTVAPGAHPTISIVVTPTATGQISNTATVTSTTPDPGPNANSATAITTLDAPAGVTCLGSTATVIGTDAGETLTGTAGDDVIAAGGGDDNVFGGGGNDKICGEAGFDTIQGGSGNDAMDAGSGGGGVDYGPTNGPVSVNLVTGQASGEGSDTLAGFSEVYGSQYNDSLIGRDDNAGLEFLAGEGGSDQLSSGGGNDRVDGGGGDDQIDGGPGIDALNGDQGGDTILSRDGAADSVTCGSEIDVVTADTLDSLNADCEQVSLPVEPSLSLPQPLPLPLPLSPGKPDTEIVRLDVKPRAHRATIRFSGGGGAVPLHFLCRLDRSSFTPCLSPKTYRGIKPGLHVIRVAAVDSNGSSDPTPAHRSFHVKPAPVGAAPH